MRYRGSLAVHLLLVFHGNLHNLHRLLRHLDNGLALIYDLLEEFLEHFLLGVVVLEQDIVLLILIHLLVIVNVFVLALATSVIVVVVVNWNFSLSESYQLGAAPVLGARRGRLLLLHENWLIVLVN